MGGLAKNTVQQIQIGGLATVQASLCFLRRPLDSAQDSDGVALARRLALLRGLVQCGLQVRGEALCRKRRRSMFINDPTSRRLEGRG